MRYLSILLLFVLPTAKANIELKATKATLYEASNERKNPLFHYSRTVIQLPNGLVRTESRFTDMNGALTYLETADSTNGRISRYEWNHYQMGESGSVEIRDGKILYTHKKGGKVQTGEGSAADNLVMGPTIITYAQNHWQKIMNGSSVAVRISVPDRMDDFGFHFRREKNAEAEKRGEIHVMLRPTSVFISAVVKPIDFIFSEDGSRLLSIKGKSLLKVKKNEKWEELVAETVFE